MSTELQHKTGNIISNDIAQESRTFLRWLNAKLKTSDKQPISDVQTGLSDGMVLVELIETLSGRKIGNKFTKINSKLRQHHLDRVRLVLECLRTDNVDTFIKIGKICGMGCSDVYMFLSIYSKIEFFFCFLFLTLLSNE